MCSLPTRPLGRRAAVRKKIIGGKWSSALSYLPPSLLLLQRFRPPGAPIRPHQRPWPRLCSSCRYSWSVTPLLSSCDGHTLLLRYALRFQSWIFFSNEKLNQTSRPSTTASPSCRRVITKATNTRPQHDCSPIPVFVFCTPKYRLL